MVVRYPVIRTFVCKNCGKIVNVRREGDKREHFCSYTCRSVYEQEHRKSLGLRPYAVRGITG